LLVVSDSSSSGTAARGPIFEASSGTDFSRLAAGSWRTSDDWLVNDGSDPVAQPWLRFSSVPEGAFAVEAEIRVENVLASVCDQSFGLAAGTPGTSAVYGAGVFFPCGGAPPVARLSDVSVWEDGYNADPVFAEDSFDPGQDWHTYRFEVRGDQIRLIVDGVGIVSAAAPAALEPGASGAETGIWSQGAAVDVRRATIHPLPPR
jgi:hypothetical protein